MERKQSALVIMSITLLAVLSGCGGKTLKMQVPDTQDMQFTRVNMEELSDESTESMVQAIYPYNLELPTGGSVALYALQENAEPNADLSITSISGAAVLNSGATILGELGTIRELAESELYRWVSSSGITEIQYTNPVQLADNRLMSHLRLLSDTVCTEQYVIYTDVGDGLARIDRVWRSYDRSDGTPEDTPPATFMSVVRALLADDISTKQGGAAS